MSYSTVISAYLQEMELRKVGSNVKGLLPFLFFILLTFVPSDCFQRTGIHIVGFKTSPIDSQLLAEVLNSGRETSIPFAFFKYSLFHPILNSTPCTHHNKSAKEVPTGVRVRMLTAALFKVGEVEARWLSITGSRCVQCGECTLN